jgi:hypothetical protein
MFNGLNCSSLLRNYCLDPDEWLHYDLQNTDSFSFNLFDMAQCPKDTATNNG